MKKTLLMVMVLTAAAVAQQSDATPVTPDPDGTVPNAASFPILRVQTPTYADLNCAGFISKSRLPNSKYIAGNLESPESNRAGRGDLVYLYGSGYELGQKYTIVREVRDLNEFEVFPAQHSILKATGQPYSDVARVSVIDTRHKLAIARVDFSCDAVNPGDFVAPYVEKASIAFHPPARFDRFAPANGKTAGRIVGTRDFDYEVGSGVKVYINVGSNQGVKPGDYFRATRSYVTALHDPVDSISYYARTSEDTQVQEPQVEPGFLTPKGLPIHAADLPERGVAELVILSTTPTTATGMIVFALEDIHAGDSVQIDETAQ